jgi:hypothetical protein
MAVLSAQDRREVPKKDFGVPSKAPGSGSYPMPDKAHAEAALRLDHNAPPSERPKIEALAHKKLGEHGGEMGGDHKAAISKMHPEHLHKLVQAAHSGQYGPEAKQMAQQAMQSPAGPPQATQPMAPKSNPFADAEQDSDQQAAAPASPGSMYGG